LAVQNHWVFVLAAEPDYTPEVAARVKYSGKKLVVDMREALLDNSLLDIARLCFLFEKFDKNKDCILEPQELKAGLEKFSIFLNDDQIDALLAEFDKDGSRGIDWNEFKNILLVSLKL